jgi:hypothetical protein
MPAMNEPSRTGDRPEPLGCKGGRPDIETSLPSGVRVQIQNRLDGAWASGFQVFAAQPSGGYLVRRLSDHSVLPITFAETELRLEPVPLPPAVESPWAPPTVA